MTVTEGDHVAVQCRSECNPTCRFNWTRGSDKTWYLNRDLLTLSAISRQYNDIYTCEAQNAYGKKTANLNINVKCKYLLMALYINYIKSTTPITGRSRNNRRLIKVLAV